MSKPIRDPKYLAWIRTLPCSIRDCRARIVEAAHTGPHGLAQKASDRGAIPLCPRHHRTGDDSYHRLGPRKFQQVHGISIREIVERLNLKPAIRIEQGSYVTSFGGERYELGPLDRGLRPAVRQAIRIVRENAA
jgi:hypothetical protein